jgi:hypothetical protein
MDKKIGATISEEVSVNDAAISNNCVCWSEDCRDCLIDAERLDFKMFFGNFNCDAQVLGWIE